MTPAEALAAEIRLHITDRWSPTAGLWWYDDGRPSPLSLPEALAADLIAAGYGRYVDLWTLINDHCGDDETIVALRARVAELEAERDQLRGAVMDLEQRYRVEFGDDDEDPAELEKEWAAGTPVVTHPPLTPEELAEWPPTRDPEAMRAAGYVPLRDYNDPKRGITFRGNWMKPEVNE